MSDDDKFNDEEYHFIDDPEMVGMHNVVSSETTTAPDMTENNKQTTYVNKILDSMSPILEQFKTNFALRLAVIGLAVILFIILIYRCTANPIVPKAVQPVSSMPVTHPQLTRAMPSNAQRSMPIDAPPPTNTVHVNMSNQRLSSLEQTQSDLQAQTTALTTQLSEINTNLTAMMDNLKSLSGQVSQLSNAVQEQAIHVADLNERLKKRTKMNISHAQSSSIPPVKYFLQAVIPGRAWLINTNGDTLTVREGTKIANYGVIRYIDAKRGRVLTSSGQMITFSQNDS